MADAALDDTFSDGETAAVGCLLHETLAGGAAADAAGSVLADDLEAAYTVYGRGSHWRATAARQR